MLVKFTLSNFLSFKNETVIDLNASSLSEYRDENIFNLSINNLSLLKSLVIYGANSSGKSNLFKAIKFVRRMILNSSKDSQAEESIKVEPFLLSTENRLKPSYFELEFIAGKKQYRYGFEVDMLKIHKEWLYEVKKTTENLLFERTLQDIVISNKFDSASNNLTTITRENALFLSVCAQFNITSAIEIIKGISDIQYLSGVDDRSTIDFTVDLLNDPEYGIYVNNFIKGARLGFEEIKTKEISLTEEVLAKSNIPQEIRKFLLEKREKNTIVTTKHLVFDDKNNASDEIYFNLIANESLGTRKYFSLAGPIIDTLLKGKTLIIDEFDARLHSHLSQSIIRLFNSMENNPNNAQLIFASHNSTFINPTNELFRRDQIIISEKNEFGASKMESIYAKGIRKDASFERDYLSGKYNGVPVNIEISNQLPLFE
ncbi:MULTISPECIES: ATP/GTP-binding protein [Flavobacteriaceae]|uniref:AAA family ATPase n=1 Tax=Flavobacteriaceae TaxID=49546 RepID=UPI001493125F|nr:MULTISPECIES: ATP-binding protein [Allomuricauda]MDC6364699.1 ATP-binding protein [Muricauda sp. AC10]